MMKRILLMLVLSMLLTGCIFQENTSEYRELSNQFDQYQLKDIRNDERFEEWLDEVTYGSTVSQVRLHIKVYDAEGQLKRTRFASGFLFAENQDYYYLLTDFASTRKNDTEELWIDVTDYKFEVYRGYVIHRSDELGMSAIRFAKNPLKVLSIPTFASTMPYVGEPLMLIGYVNRTMNGIRMGLVVGYEPLSNGNHVMNTSIPTDINAQGALIVNINNEVVGIQFDANGELSRAYDIHQIHLMIDEVIIE